MMVFGLLLVAMLGIVFFLFGYVFNNPMLQMMFSWIGFILLAAVPFIFVIRLKTTDTYKQFEKVPRQKGLFEYLRRDGQSIDVVGNRIYSGESFIDVPKLGLIEDFGKDCVFTKGVNKKRFVLENLNYSVDPRYANFTNELYKIGFENSEEVWTVLNIPRFNDENPVKSQALELMGVIYTNMNNGKSTGVHRLVKELSESKPVEPVVFKHVEEKKPIEYLVDKVLNR